MESIYLLVLVLIFISTTIFLILQNQKLKQKIFMLEKNPDQGLELISDLIRTSNCVVRIHKIDQSEMFLRSPRT